MEARILNLSDAFDAMTTQRSYNVPKTLSEALECCNSEAGVSFDAACVEALHDFIHERFSRDRMNTLPAKEVQEEQKDLNKTSTFDAEMILKYLPKDEETTRDSLTEVTAQESVSTENQNSYSREANEDKELTI